METLNRQEIEDLVVDLYCNQKKKYREIQQITRKSPRDIKKILDRGIPGRSSMAPSSKAYKMFSEGKSPTEVAITLGIREPEANQFFREYWKLNQSYELYQICEETNGDLSTLIELYKQMRNARLTIPNIIKLLKVANNDIQSIERTCEDLRREEALLTANNLHASKTFEQLGNDISEEHRLLNHYRDLCTEEHLALTRLRIEKVRRESIVKQFRNNNEDYLKVREKVKQTVQDTLMNYRGLLRTAFISVIDSCRSDPSKFNILYHNLPIVTKTTELPSLPSRESGSYTNGLYSDEQSRCNYTNNDYVYENFLLDKAEQLFSQRVEDLTEAFLDSMINDNTDSPKLLQPSTETYPDSEVVPSADVHVREKANKEDQHFI